MCQGKQDVKDRYTSSLAVAYSSVISSITSSAVDLVDSQRLKLLTCEALRMWRRVLGKRGRDSVASGLAVLFEHATRLAVALDSTVRDSMVCGLLLLVPTVDVRCSQGVFCVQS
jgi:hypothetical protein